MTVYGVSRIWDDNIPIYLVYQAFNIGRNAVHSISGGYFALRLHDISAAELNPCLSNYNVVSIYGL